MPIADLTNFDPWSAGLRANQQALEQRNRAIQGTIDRVINGVQAGRDRRAALQERNRAIRDREYAIANQATDQLVQASTNHKYTDQQLQQVGQQFKQEFYDAVKVYEQSDKGDEARQEFEAVKAKSLGSARTIGASIDALGTQMDAFKDQAATSQGISDAMNPAVRSFFGDLNDPNTPPDQFQIVTDEATGQLKYQGQTSDGHDVDFFLEDIANGENQFAPVPAVDMPKVVNNLLKGVSNLTKTEKTDGGGVYEVTDWDTLGLALDGRMDDLMADDKSFRSLAAGLGYGYEEIQAAEAGELEGIGGIEELRKEMKQELLDQIESVTPHMNREVQRAAQDVQTQQAVSQRAQNIEAQGQLDSAVANAAGKEDEEYFKSQILGRVKGVDNLKIQDGKLVFISGAKTPKQVFNLKSQGDLARLTEFMGGNRDLAGLESNIINF